MKPLYCYRLDKDTGAVSKYTITNYSRTCISKYTQRYAIFYNEDIGSGVHRYEVYENNLDKLVNSKIHTFDPDFNIQEVIIESIKDRMEKAHNEYNKWNILYEKLITKEVSTNE